MLGIRLEVTVIKLIFFKVDPQDLNVVHGLHDISLCICVFVCVFVSVYRLLER